MKNFTVNPLIGGYSVTLITYALYYLEEAESIYGPRTTDYIYGGVELIEVGPSRVWYPFSNFIVIQLSKDTATDFKLGMFQLAHEVIHVLSPNGNEATNNLEEGLASYFSKFIIDRDTHDSFYAINLIIFTKSYFPYELVCKLLEIRPDAIIELRKVQPVLGKVTKEDFQKSNLNIPEDLIDDLIMPMDRRD